MAADSQNLIDRFSSLSSLPVARQLRLLIGIAASTALGLGLVQWALTPEYTPLFGQLSTDSSAGIIQSLETQNISYKVDSRSGLISVPGDQVREVRLKLASEGLPFRDSAGFDVLNQEPGLGVSSFMEKARYDRALEQELSSSIASLDNVRSARVHLALPKQSAFVRKKNKPAASVLVSLYPGRALSERELAGVVHLVAFSVPGMEAEQVSVIDNRGRLLSAQSKGDEFASTQENFRYTQQLEQRYVERITDILTPILGVGAVEAQVAAELDFTVIERTSEQYAPETNIRSEELVEELSGERPAGGIPGTLSNQPPQRAEVVDDVEQEVNQQLASRSSKREVRNYELGKTISHVRETPGTLQKLTVAVVVDYREQVNDEGVTERVPLSQEELAEVTTLVKEAVGYDEARGDRVNVVNASFVPPPELEPLPEAPIFQQEWVWRTVKIVLAGLAVLMTIFFVVRPLMQAPLIAATDPKAIPGAAGPEMLGSASPEAMGDDRVSLGYAQTAGLPGSGPGYQQQLSMARSVVQGEPERAANVVKNWVAGDG